MQQPSTYPYQYLLNESHSLLARLAQLDPFSMTMPMVRGAAVSDKAMKEITELLEKGKTALKGNIHSFIATIQSFLQQKQDSRELQTGFTILKLRFNSILDQLDIFADVLSQRSEHEVGVWLSGLDVLAEDGLAAVKPFAELPSLMVYLDRGHGAAIRRARTKLPGGDVNPVAVIQMPRERMVGSGIAASLIHEVGHQAAALLDLVASLKKILLHTARERTGHPAWKYFEKWISEIICDVWAMGHLGIASTVGLMGVVTLPRYFQFRLNLNDPHPAPYVRVYLSYVFGKTLFPHPQWDKIWNMWKNFYPLDGLGHQVKAILRDIETEADQFANLVLSHSTKEMKGQKLQDLFFGQQRNPASLQALYQSWKSGRTNLDDLPPTLVFATLGQAKADLAIEATNECTVLIRQLKYWANTRK